MIFHRLLYQSLFWRSIYMASLFLLNVVISRIYGANGSGSIFFISSVLALFIQFSSFSIESAMGFYYAEKRVLAAELVSVSFWWTLAAGILAWSLAYFVFDGHLSSGYIVNFPRCAASFVAGNLLISFFNAMYLAEKRPAIPNIILAVTNLSLIAIGVWIYFRGDLSRSMIFVEAYFHSFLLASLLMGVFFMIEKKIPLLVKLPSRKTMKLLLRYSKLAFIAGVITFVLFRIDYFFVERYCNGEALGNYIQVSKLAQLFFVIPAILASSIFPLTAGGQRWEVNQYLPVLSRIIMMIFGAGSLVLALSGWYLFPAVFGEEFDGMYIPFLIMIPGMLAICLIYPVTSYYAGKDRIRENIIGSLIAVVVLIAGDAVAVPQFGMIGAAFVCSISYLLYGLYMINRFSKEYDVAMTDFFAIRRTDLTVVLNMFKKNSQWI